MPRHQKTWTKQAVERLKYLLGVNTTLAAVVADFEHYDNFNVTIEAIRWACRTYLHTGPSKLLGTAAPFAKGAPVPPPQAPVPQQEPDHLREAIEHRLQKREESATKKALARALDRLETQQRLIDTLSAPIQRPAFSIVKTLSSDKRKAWGLACLSDVHAGAFVVPSVSTYYNEYDPDICRHSLDRYFEAVVWKVKRQHAGVFDIEGVLQWIGGDIIDGHLHDDQIETSEAPLVTLNWLEPFLLGRIEQTATELGPNVEYRIMCDYGNHSRDTAKPRTGTAWAHSHEWAMYQRIARHFEKHPTVRVLTTRARDHYTNIYGFEIHGTHGDTTSRYSGGVGGITIPLRKSYATWQKLRPAYLHLTGHWHTQLDIGDGLANGSVVGYNDYARSISLQPEAPQQIFCLIDSKRGKTDVAPLWVRDISQQQQEALARGRKEFEERTER